jgi:DNA gyrase subunit B
MKPNLNNQQDYTADQIQVLEGLEPVRKRPGMYIGSTDINGLNHLVTEIVNNSMDEAIAGFADHIKVEFFEDGSVAVYDNGRGIPYGIKKEYGVSALELAYTKLHAGGKFGGGGYKVSSGLHGVGASVVNALSEWCRVIVRNDSETVIQEYANGGKVIRPVEVLDLKKPQTKVKGGTWNLDLASWPYKKGTIVQFKPDATIFETTDLKNRFFVNSFREYAFLTAGIKFELIDYRDDTKYTFYFEGGIKSYLRSLNRNKTLLNPTPFYVSKELDGITVEAAFQYNDTYNENILCFANHIKNNEGGSHLTGFKSALTKSINDYARRKAMLKEKDDNFSGEDLREGLTAIISVKLSSDTLQFEGQTKAKLGNSNVKPAVETVVKEALENFLEENPKDAQAIIEKNLLTMRARMAAKAARDTVIRKTALDGGSVLPGKLADCSNKDPEKTEIFIVEGDSAGGCFSGDTLIALADGRNIPFKQIVEEQEKGVNHFCYTIDSDGAVAIERFINARITRRNAEVIKIHLDSKQTITCTPDHLFMLRDGTYKRADLLTKEDSIMPLYRKLSDKLDAGITIDGYEMVWNPQSEKWVFTHLLADKHNIDTGMYNKTNQSHCHHIDFNKYNNNPDNIVRLDKQEHLELHKNHIAKTLHTEAAKAKAREVKKSDEYRKKMSLRMQDPITRQILSHNAKKQWSNEDYKSYMTASWKEFYKKNTEYRENTIQNLNISQKKYWADPSNKQEQAKKIKAYYEINPAVKVQQSVAAKAQWKDPQLLEWRKSKTKEQWTTEFRQRRTKALTETYFKKTMQFLKKFGTIDMVNVETIEQERIKTKDKSILKFNTFCERYYAGNLAQTIEAINHFNHKINNIERLTQKIDVYDAEVPNTHNFALASGVFVHNSAKAARNRETQAILPIFGKPLNTERARLDKIVDSDKFKYLIMAIGAGIGEHYNPKKLRYNKIILMSDADVDGMHILTLYLTFFFRHMPEILENGHVYAAMPPLFKGTWGKNKKYLFNDVELSAFLKTPEGTKATVQRFKGLGEMNAEELWETTMNPATRYLKQINSDDAAKADEVFTMLMGDEVAPRKRFIMTHAKQALVDM